MIGTTLDLVTIGQAVADHGRRLRDDVDAGRLDHVEEALAAREQALRALAELVATLPRPLDDDVETLLSSLREDDRLLREWMSMEKQRVGRALASLKGRATDPYEQKTDDPAPVLDRRG